MKQTPKHKISYPEGTDLVRHASAQFEAMAQSIDDNIDDLPDTITQKVTEAQAKTEAAAAQAEKYGSQAQALQDGAVATLLSDTTSASYAASRGTIAFIGDSWTAGTGASSNEWRFSTVICRQLGTAEANYGVGMNGYVNQYGGANDFVSQAGRLADDITAGKVKNLRAVIVLGGFNDRWSEHTAGEVQTAVKNVVNTIRKTTPAPILVGAFNDLHGYYPDRLTGGLARAIRTACAETAGLGVHYVADVVYPLIQWRANALSGNHPNNLGHGLVADRFMAALGAGGAVNFDAVLNRTMKLKDGHDLNVTARYSDTGSNATLYAWGLAIQNGDNSDFLLLTTDQYNIGPHSDGLNSSADDWPAFLPNWPGMPLTGTTQIGWTESDGTTKRVGSAYLFGQFLDDGTTYQLKASPTDNASGIWAHCTLNSIFATMSLPFPYAQI